MFVDAPDEKYCSENWVFGSRMVGSKVLSLVDKKVKKDLQLSVDEFTAGDIELHDH